MVFSIGMSFYVARFICRKKAKKRTGTGITIDGEKMKEVAKYLGKMLTRKNKCWDELEDDIRIEEIWPIQSLFERKNIPNSLKRKIIDIVILSSLTYRAEA